VRRGAATDSGWRADHLGYYLPADRAGVGRVLVGLYLPSPRLLTPSGDLLVDADAPVLDAPFEQLAREALAILYGSALARALPPAPAAGMPGDTAALEASMLRAIQEKGLVAYVTAQGFDLDAVPDAYRLSLDRDEVAARFFALEDVLRELAADDGPAEVRTRYRAMTALDAREQTFAVIGAYLAAVIEARRGHDALIDTIREGPRAFWQAYVATRPGATVWMPLPSAAPEATPRRATPATSH
jgi:hypothetical protein